MARRNAAEQQRRCSWDAPSSQEAVAEPPAGICRWWLPKGDGERSPGQKAHLSHTAPPKKLSFPPLQSGAGAVPTAEPSEPLAPAPGRGWSLQGAALLQHRGRAGGAAPADPTEGSFQSSLQGKCVHRSVQHLLCQHSHKTNPKLRAESRGVLGPGDTSPRSRGKGAGALHLRSTRLCPSDMRAPREPCAKDGGGARLLHCPSLHPAPCPLLSVPFALPSPPTPPGHPHGTSALPSATSQTPAAPKPRAGKARLSPSVLQWGRYSP